MEIETFKGVTKSIGYTPHFIQHVSAVAQDCRDGVFSGTNDLVEKLTGQKPLQLVDYIIKNKAVFSLAEKNHNNEHRTREIGFQHG
jgi:NAD(P)H dehydrogenase (quinone)